MRRLNRLYSTAIVCLTVVASLLLFTVAGVRDFLDGRPFFLVVLLSATVAVAGLGCVCLAVADRVAERDERLGDAATI